MIVRAKKYAIYLSMICEITVITLHVLLDPSETKHQVYEVKSCTKCGKSYMNLYDLARHISLVHQMKYEKPVQIEIQINNEINTELLFEIMNTVNVNNDCDEDDFKQLVDKKEYELDTESYSNVEVNQRNDCELRNDADIDMLKVETDLENQNSDEEDDMKLENGILNVKSRNRKSISCSRCLLTFDSLKQLVHHKNAEHMIKEDPKKETKIDLRCSKCDKTYLDKRALKEHIITKHTKLFPVHCDFCGKGYTKKNLRSHKKVCPPKVKTPELDVKRNEKGERIWVCEKCAKIFKKSSQLQRHEKKHLKVKDFQCSDCDVAYADKRNLIMHVNLKHPDSSLQFGLPCDLCNERFSTKTRVEFHKIEKHGGGSYRKICEACGKGFLKHDFNRAVQNHQKVCPGNSKKSEIS